MKKLTLAAAFLLALAAAGLAQPALKAKGKPILWKEFFPDFPAVRMGMKFDAAKKAVERTGATTVSVTREEMVWDATFAGTMGRATMFFKPRTGAWEVAVVVYAMEKKEEISAAWRKRIEARSGPPSEVHDDEYALSYVWRYKDGTALELRTPKGPDGTVVDIHWVRSDSQTQ